MKIEQRINMIGIAAVAVVFAVIGGCVYYFMDREPCVGECGRLTHSNEEGEYICESCAVARKIKAQADAEERVMRPHGHGSMEKIINDDVVLDHCPLCKGFWFDGEELEKLKQRYISEGRSQGQASGQAVGIAVGMAIGNSIKL